jgi:cytochrome b
MSDRDNVKPVPVWDLPTRLFHWSLAALMVAAVASNKLNAMDWHMRFGLSILALVLFRLVWGFVGGTYSRFADFVKGPGRCFSYFKGMLTGREPPVAGHNPLAGLVMMALLLALAVHAGLGLFGNDDIIFDAPLSKMVSKKTSDLLTTYHKYLFKGILALVALHVAAALYHALVKKEDLIRAMITGKKSLPAGADLPPARMGSPWVAALILALAGLAVWGITKI